MNISELARHHHISPAAIRHYERLGLLDDSHVRRLPNGYRDFTPEASRRLGLIKLGQAAGFSLTTMRAELHHWDDGTMPPNRKKEVLHMQLRQIDQKIAELNATREHIKREIAKDC